MVSYKKHQTKAGSINNLSKLFSGGNWVEFDEYSTNCRNHFNLELSKHAARFPLYKRLIDRFDGCVKQVRGSQKGLFHLVHEAHNELCVALALLENLNPSFGLLEYEPALSGTAKSIDFRALSGGDVYYVDVKTIRPKFKNKWNQYEQLKNNISYGINLLLDKDWLGGEIWHGLYSSRGKMLEYSRELEEKVFDGNLSQERNRIIMVFCGDNYHWHEDDLEDFVEFYHSGNYRNDDPFSEMEGYSIKSKNYFLNRTITNFCFLKRRQMEIGIEGINWNVGRNSNMEKINY